MRGVPCCLYVVSGNALSFTFGSSECSQVVVFSTATGLENRWEWEKIIKNPKNFRALSHLNFNLKVFWRSLYQLHRFTKLNRGLRFLMGKPQSARRKTCPIEVRYIASLGPAVIKVIPSEKSVGQKRGENDRKSENFQSVSWDFLGSFAMLTSKVLECQGKNMRISVSCPQVTLYSMRDVLCEVDSDLQVYQCSSSQEICHQLNIIR